jgi:hypothetical protein
MLNKTKLFVLSLAVFALAFGSADAAGRFRGSTGGGGGGGITATFRSQSSINSGATTFTIPLPAGAQNGDVVLLASDNGNNTTPTSVTLFGGGTCAPKSNFGTAYGGAFYFACILGAGDLGGGIVVAMPGTADNYWWATDYAISGGAVTTITAQDHQIVSSGSMTFGSFTPAASHVKTVVLAMTFTSQSIPTPSGWTGDVDFIEVPPGNTGMSFSAFSKVSGTAPVVATSGGQSNGVEFELASS